ncbi:ATP-binding protein [Olivibacter ginsenosidimutans]|uniref:ATP-binding protein n=1 Tax=Olivibacter ginsenosidimutans TaxID=1176537 RepID=A0ABP9BXV1_9SPHI
MMIRQEQISAIIVSQQESFLNKRADLPREALPYIPIVDGYATIITGIRRCGKSTMLLQLLKKKYKNALYVNFEDIRLAGFEVSDFNRLKEAIDQQGTRVLFFDEIQLTEKWEIFVHHLLREAYTVFITGSNASLLSKELGTHLTGRHLSKELFPFSFNEYARFKKLNTDKQALLSYLNDGGLPEYVKHREPLILQQLLEDILVSDIAVRHGIRDTGSLKQLTVYLISNVGSPVSANKLVDMFGIRSSATILEYFNYLTDAYLIEFLPQFSYSLKAQSRNPKKVYTIDNGFLSTVATSFTENLGRKLENLIYQQLRRNYQELYFFSEKGECDFIVFVKGRIHQAIQVCYQINDLNFDREYRGLLQALQFFQIKEGFMITWDQKDVFQEKDYTIHMVPAYEYLMLSGK